MHRYLMVFIYTSMYLSIYWCQNHATSPILYGNTPENQWQWVFLRNLKLIAHQRPVTRECTGWLYAVQLYRPNQLNKIYVLSWSIWNWTLPPSACRARASPWNPRHLRFQRDGCSKFDRWHHPCFEGSPSTGSWLQSCEFGHTSFQQQICKIIQTEKNGSNMIKHTKTMGIKVLSVCVTWLGLSHFMSLLLVNEDILGFHKGRQLRTETFPDRRTWTRQQPTCRKESYSPDYAPASSVALASVRIPFVGKAQVVSTSDDGTKLIHLVKQRIKTQTHKRLHLHQDPSFMNWIEFM